MVWRILGRDVDTGSGGFAVGEGGEFRIGLEPGTPTGGEGFALALAGQDTVEMGAVHPHGAGGERGAGIPDLLAAGLFRDGDGDADAGECPAECGVKIVD